MVAATGTKVPGIGHLSKKEMYIGGGLAGAVIIIALYRQHKNSQAAAAAAASTTSTGSNIDPATGDIAGSPEDVAALEAQAGYANSTAYGYSSGGYSTGTSGTIANGFTSNSQWSQAAEEYLVQYTGADAATVGKALGAYLAGSYVTTDQYTIIEQALAFEGAPPQSGTNGYPPSINTVKPGGVTIGGGNPPSGNGGNPVGAPGKSLPPPGTVIYGPALVKPGFNINQIAAHFGESVQHIMNDNPGIPNPPPNGTTLRIGYLIKPGMTLQSVANAFMISIEHLQEYL